MSIKKIITEEHLKETCLAWAKTYSLPHINFDEWLKERNKPAKKKIIDLSPLIASGIDCEFSDDGEKWQIWSLVCIHGPFRSNRHFEDGLHGLRWEKCRPRMNHKIFHDVGKCRECPLPEGFVVKIYYSDRGNHTSSEYAGQSWGFAPIADNNIIGYEILGLADGYAYPWEQLS